MQGVADAPHRADAPRRAHRPLLTDDGRDRHDMIGVGRALAGSLGIECDVTGAMPAGTYTVAWRTAAADGHATTGHFSFVVASPAVPAPMDEHHALPAAPTTVEPGPAGFLFAERWA